MALYTFTLQKYTIYNTRSRHQDTDQGVVGLAIGTEQFPAQTFSSGDVNNGDHSVNLSFGPIPIGSNVPMVITYQIYNGDTSKLSISLPDLNRDLGQKAVEYMMPRIEQGDLSDFTDFPSNGEAPDRADDPFIDSSWIQVLEFIDIGSLIFPDCDGYTVIGTVGKATSGWDTLIDKTGGVTFAQTIRYPGSDSPQGCGSNSDYSVTYSVTRKSVTGPGPHSLKRFLSDNRLTLSPGLRSLDRSTAGQISLKTMMER
jgi:hypothetical protein